MAVNHTDYADDRWIDLVVHSVWEPLEQDTTQMASDHRVALRCLGNALQGVVHRRQESLRRSRRSLQVPLEGRDSFGSRNLANTDRRHLPELLTESVSYLGPIVAFLGRSVGVSLAAIELCRQRRRDRRCHRRIEAIPELSDQRYALFGGQVVERDRAGHMLINLRPVFPLGKNERCALTTLRLCCGRPAAGRLISQTVHRILPAHKHKLPLNDSARQAPSAC